MIVDIVVLAVVILSALIAFLRGFIRETLTILGVGGGIVAALLYGPKLVPLVRDWFGIVDGKDVEKLFDLVPMTLIADFSTYAAIFIIVVMVLSIVSHFLAGAAKAMGLGAIDRTLGIIFGIVRAVVLLALLYLPFHLLMDDESKKSFFAESKTHLYIEGTAKILMMLLPEQEDAKPADKTDEDPIQKKLKELDILKGDKPARKEETPPQSSPGENEVKLPEQTGLSAPGYDKDERQELNELFQGGSFDEPGNE